MQPGFGYNLTSGQAGITLAIDEPQLAGDPEQFRVTVIKTGAGYGVQCRKGFVHWLGYRAADPFVQASFQGEVRKYFCFPDGSKTTGPFSESKDSPLVDLGGYVQIQPASVEGGSDNWKVCLIGCATTESAIVPYLAIFADDSDADTKSRFFNGASDQIIVRNLLPRTILDVETPDGTSTINFSSGGELLPYNYNCQRYLVADLTFEGDTFVVQQFMLGQFTMPYPVNYQGDFPYIGEDGPPIWAGTPYYDDKLTDWHGAWSGYTKNSSGATAEIIP
jgi:hypothetical protein